MSISIVPLNIVKNLVIVFTMPLIAVVLIHFVPWLVDPKRIRDIQGPFLAKFSDAWLSYWALMGKKSKMVHKLHLEKGDFIVMDTFPAD